MVPCIIQIYSGIILGKVLSGELYADVNLPVFVYRLFHEDISPILITNFR